MATKDPTVVGDDRTAPLKPNVLTKSRNWLPLARVAWLAIVFLSLITWIAAVSTDTNLILQGNTLPHLETLSPLGLSPQFSALFFVVTESIIVLVTFTCAVVMFWRKPDDWTVLLFSLALITLAVLIGDIELSLLNNYFWRVVCFVMSLSGETAAFTVLAIFPDGHFVPHWQHWLIFPCMAYNGFRLYIGFGLAQQNITLYSQLDVMLYLGLMLLAFGINIPAQVYRYRRFLTPTQRQQTKWLLFSIITFAICLLFLALTGNLWTTGVPAQLYDLGTHLLSKALFLVMVLSIAFAMLRYRLWDVDLVINRGLVYGGLTLALGTFFFVAIFALQGLLSAVLGSEQTTLATIISTASVVALFEPTRRRIQHFVDRRFFHLRFDLNQIAKQQQKQQPMIQNPIVLSSKMLGPYELYEVIGRGGMGEVYKGRHPALERTVAIKILPPDLAGNMEFRVRFEREAKIVAALRHPNIVNVFDSGNADGIYYMVMEFINGRDLSDYLTEHGALSVDDALPLIRDIASALDYAHEQGLVHRDVKPSNVMLQKITSANPDTSQQQAILMDFGITKIGSSKSGLTHTGAIGTLHYMAPEQITSAHEVDRRADVYALGIVVYQMFTGKLPFPSDNLAQVVFAHLQQPAPDPREVRADLSSSIAQSILRALAKNPEDRYQTAGAFAAAL